MLLSSCLMAEDIYTPFYSNKALQGYDTVAFFTKGKAVKGADSYRLELYGVDWLFSSEENLRLFKKNPEKYRPQYGGYCAWAVGSKNSKAPGDPNYWRIVDGKLYLNYDKRVQQKWLDDIPGFIQRADQNWPQLKD